LIDHGVGCLHRCSLQLRRWKEAQESAQTIDEKKEFVTAFMQSGVLKEFQDVNSKLEELNKWQS
jgi:hypothetical protein